MNRHTTSILIAATILLSATTAAAQAAPSIEPINNLATSILGVITGPLARTVAAIAVAIVGWSWKTGRVNKGTAVSVIVGIIIVFGAATIVQWLDTVA